MNKKLSAIPVVISLLLALSGFSPTGEKTVSSAVVYGVTAVLSAIVFIVFFVGIRKKNPWFVLLFTSVSVVNIGYLSLALSKNLDEALLANRISYLGSVFLPLSILMIIFEATKIRCRRFIPATLIGIGILVFLIAASPGYLDIYYKEVSLVTVNGASMLSKVYGPLHVVYLIYLMSYFAAMVVLIAVTAVKKRMDGTVQGVILLCSVFVNIIVWLLEQFVKIDFEILSVSYVVTELFLLLLCFLIQENERHREKTNENGGKPEVTEATEVCEKEESCDRGVPGEEKTEFSDTEEYRIFTCGLGLLTNTERKIYDFYVDGKSTREILLLLDITENTLKYHNKNIYGKLGVSSRKQLKEIAFRLEE